MLLGTAVTAIDRGRRPVTLSDGGHPGYDRLMLATGSVPRRLPLPGADAGGAASRIAARELVEEEKGTKTMKGTDIRVRRVYEEPSPDDGARILVDWVWPRGIRKVAARLDDWARDVAPSAELRTWYQHDPAKFDEFRRRYTAELAEPGAREALRRIRTLAAGRPVTLLTATRDLNLSQAAVLAGLLREKEAEHHAYRR